MENKMNSRIGLVSHNKYETSAKIIKYFNAKKMIVRSEEYNYEWTMAFKEFDNNNFKTPYDKSVYGIGYFGLGKYKSGTKEYDMWYGMIKRVVGKDCHSDNYKECSICDEWLCYQSFAEWYHANIYSCNNAKLSLDKDILVKNNKLYSPETCLIVPQVINSLFCKSKKVRGEYPIGISKIGNQFYTQVSDRRYGTYNKKLFYNLDDAWDFYIKSKKSIIRQYLNEFKEYLPKKVYNAILNYEIRKDD